MKAVRMSPRISLKAAAVFFLLGGSAFAQSPVTGGGTVTAIGGDENAVFMLRGNGIVALSEGDELVDGDRVFTRTNGAVTLSLDGCVKELEDTSFLPINSEACSLEPFRLSDSDPKSETQASAEVDAAPPSTWFDLANIASGGGASGYQGTNDNPVRAIGP